MAFHEDLKNYRLKQNITLEEIADRTKININTLRSFEEGDFTILPTTYVRLFLKAYAKEIGMTEEEVLRNYENEVQFAGKAEAQARKESARRAEQPGYPSLNPSETAEKRVLLHNPNKPATRKIVISGIAIVLVIIFGKIAMNASNNNKSAKAPMTPPPVIDLFHKTDSLKWGLSGLLSDSNSVSVQAKAGLTIYVSHDATKLDTIVIDSGETYQGYFQQQLSLYAYPSRNADFVLLDQPFSPVNPGDSWTRLEVKNGQSALYTYTLK